MIDAIACWIAGWRWDLDGWLVRARRDTDPDLVGRSDVGFTEESCIAVRTRAQAREIDRRLTPSPTGFMVTHTDTVCLCGITGPGRCPVCLTTAAPRRSPPCPGSEN